MNDFNFFGTIVIGVVVDGDIDGLASDEVGQLFDHERPFKSIGMVVIGRRTDLKSLVGAIDVIGVLTNQGQIV